MTDLSFSKETITIVKAIAKQLFRIFAHIYYNHIEKVILLQQEAHLNTTFAHFVCFIEEFNLVDKKELLPLAELIQIMSTNELIQ